MKIDKFLLLFWTIMVLMLALIWTTPKKQSDDCSQWLIGTERHCVDNNEIFLAKNRSELFTNEKRQAELVCKETKNDEIKELCKEKDNLLKECYDERIGSLGYEMCVADFNQLIYVILDFNE